jgi:hypothetical protein
LSSISAGFIRPAIAAVPSSPIIETQAWRLALMDKDLADVVIAALALILSVAFFIHDRTKSRKQCTVDFFKEFLSKEAFLLRSYGFSLFQMPAQDYETVVLVYLGDANVRNLARDRSTLFLSLTPGEALAVVLNRLRVVRLLSESDLLTEDGVLLFRYHLLYWQPFVQRLLIDMYSRYSAEPTRYIYHPWFEDLPWIYERCGLPATFYPRLPERKDRII